MIRKTIVLLAGMLVTVAVYAAGAQLRADHPDSYTVRRGDTLWDISAKFLSKPWLWPEIWQANPQVRNPHLIYPGDVLNLSFINGPRLGLQPSVHREGEAVPAIPLSELRMFLKDMRVMDSKAVSSAPYVVGLEESRLRGAVGQNIYVRGLQGEPGQRWAIVRPSHVFRGFDQNDAAHADLVAHDLDSNAAMVRAPWREDSRNDGHYGKGDDLGVEVSVIGTAETLRTGDPATLLLLGATQEIRSGDRIMPVDDAPYDAYYYPHPPKSVPANAKVIGFADAMDAAGSRQVVLLSVGAKDGVDNGQTFAMFQPGETVHDDVASNSWNRGVGETVKLPDEYIGHVMVFRTFDRVSYGLVMDGLRPVHVGSRLVMPE
ncbi:MULTISPECIES: LysM peptidoglycan-binding domain-containing protein [unclassified Rhodanobacter]|uniref:LysM peptidoglycan-binding domain-containing protein n=1 Tax=unclassified Rhodanobacter TaxID=2621553 RepID=UPI0007AA2043|nr:MULTISPECIES: LysM domain-containing protein [unclassified Rhodanobacter]KZC16917.1 peptidoglycan-binding protein [Rhodanobacter sp. FW104-R8]KZC27266.1 peptidoglycan-binding protein [Rhodanobacter sp. FW510-T8]KZC31703.1 peptidoglycan-binding protein [Rhodanobacter sp. FW510-R10]